MPYETICRQLGLGDMTSPPRPLSGGYTHRMIALTTTRGRFAVKLLNPEIMRRPEAIGNFRRAEGFEARLEALHLPILPALTIGGRKMQQVGPQYLYVFDYFDGAPLGDAEITPFHAGRMGALLASIHGIERRTGEGRGMPEEIDWTGLAAGLLAQEAFQAEGRMLLDAVPLLEGVTRRSIEAAKRLTPEEAICHNDMDPKNVLWRGTECRVIDLECLGFADPRQEMLDLAVAWGGWPLGEECFKAFAGAYLAAGGAYPEDPAAVFDSRRNHIEWLASSAVRALADDPGERAIGRSQIGETIGKITSDQANRARVLRWLAECRSQAAT